MRTSKTVALTLGGVAIVALVSLGLFLMQGFSAREEPSRLEARIAKLARAIATPRETKNLQNPYSSSEEGALEVKRHFVEHCATCHALDGNGNTIFGRNMYPRVPDLRGEETQDLTDGELYYIIANGIRFTGMPAFGAEETPEEIWGLVPLLRRLPSLSKQELEEMQRMAMESMSMESIMKNDSPEAEVPSHMHDEGD